MKQILCFSLLMGLSVSTVYSAETHAPTQLSPQKSAALAAHLTTRIQWKKFPSLQYQNTDLKDQNRSAIIRVYADEVGNVSKATVQESTGLAYLDQLLVKAVSEAKVKPYIKNDTAMTMVGYQTFNLKLDQQPNLDDCQYNFNSKNWQAQKIDKNVAFSYRSQPTLAITTEQLNQHSRSAKFSFKVNKKGEVKKVKITQGSGVYAIDQAIVQAVLATKVDAPRNYWVYKKSTFKDQISFDLNNCQ